MAHALSSEKFYSKGLRGTGIGDEFALVLADMLRGPTCTIKSINTVRLTGNNVGNNNDGEQALADALSSGSVVGLVGAETRRPKPIFAPSGWFRNESNPYEARPD